MNKTLLRRATHLAILFVFFLSMNGMDNQIENENALYISNFPLATDVIGIIHIDGLSPSLGWDDCGWVNGSGSFADPYIIKDLIIDGMNLSSCIYIKNTREYFKIQNCTVFNAKMYEAGIYLKNITTGMILGNNCTLNIGDGIKIESANNCTIENNTVKQNGIYHEIKFHGCGMNISSLENSTIKGNNITKNIAYGILAYFADHNIITGNNITFNDCDGIFLRYTDWTNITNNFCTQNDFEGIVLMESTNNNITRNWMHDQQLYSIYLYLANYNSITFNNGTFNDYGIYIRESSNNTIDSNIFTNNQTGGYYGLGIDKGYRNYCVRNYFTNGSYGILLENGASNNTIINNTCIKSKIGISMRNSPNNTISASIMDSCGLQIKGTLNDYFNMSIDSNNYINGKLIRVYTNQSDVVIPADTAQAILINSKNIVLQDSQSSPILYNFYYSNDSRIQNCSIGPIDIYGANNFTIYNNTADRSLFFESGVSIQYSNYINVTKNDLHGIAANYGIYLNYANNNTIHYNNCSNITGGGIFLYYSNSNNVTENDCEDLASTWPDGGIRISASNYNRVIGNNCSRTASEGMRIDGMYNYVAFNNVSENVESGIYVGCPFNLIAENKCWKNKKSGIHIGTSSYDSESSTAFHNECWSNDVHGIVVTYAKFANVSDNRLYSNKEAGMRIFQCEWSNISRNNVTGNMIRGIEVITWGNNTILENYVASNSQGNMWIEGTGNRLINNTVKTGLSQYGIRINYADNTLLMGNNCTSNPLSGICLIGSDFCTILNNTSMGHPSGNGGIELQDSNNNTIANNSLSKNYHGLYLRTNSMNNSIFTNNCSTNTNFGMWISDGANNNTIIGNNCSNNSVLGLYITTSGNYITHNNISYNIGSGGMSVGSMSFNYIAWNNCSRNIGNGLNLFSGSTSNEVSHNFARDNTGENFNDQGTMNYVHDNFWGAGPYVSFTLNATTIIAGQSIQFFDTSFAGSLPYIYNWSFGDLSQNSTEQNPIHSFSSEGNYLIQLIIRDSVNVNSSCSIWITVLPDKIPIASFTTNVTTPFFVNQWICVNDTSVVGNNPMRYEWNFGDSTGNFTSQNVTHQFTSANIFTVILTINDTDGDISVMSTQITVIVDTQPVAGFIANDTTILVGEWIKFNDTTTSGNVPLHYEWNFGDNTGNFTDQNVTHQFTTVNAFTVILTVNDTDGDISVVSMQITVEIDIVPTASFTTNATNIMVNNWILCTDITTGGNKPFTYQWYFGDSTGNVTTQNAVHQYTSINTFTITLTVNDTDGDFSVYRISITVIEQNFAPTITKCNDIVMEYGSAVAINFTVTDNTVNAPKYFIYRNGSSVLSYQPWTSGVQNQFFLAMTKPGNYRFVITAQDGFGLSISTTVYVNITNAPPRIEPVYDIRYFTGSEGNQISLLIIDNSTFFPNLTIYRNNELIGKNITWISGVTTVINIDGLPPGTYIYRIVVNDGIGGTTTIEVQVIVVNMPVGLYISLGIIIPGVIVGVLFYLKKKRFGVLKAIKR